MKYPITTAVTVIAAIVILYYLYVRYTNYGKIVFLETKLSYTLRRHKIAIVAVLVLLFIIAISYNIESEWKKITKLVEDYKKLREYVVRLASGDSTANPQTDPEGKLLRRIQYTTNNYGLRGALKEKEWGIALELMDDMLTKQNPYFKKVFEESCKAGETACAFIGGKPGFGLIKYLQPKGGSGF